MNIQRCTPANAAACPEPCNPSDAATFAARRGESSSARDVLASLASRIETPALRVRRWPRTPERGADSLLGNKGSLSSTAAAADKGEGGSMVALCPGAG